MAAALESRPAEILELTNGRFIDVAAGRPFPDGTRLLVQDGKILSLAAPGGPASFCPARVIDLGGRAVIPGLINAHCHIQIAMPAILSSLWDWRLAVRLRTQQIEHDLRTCLEHGVTCVRDTWSRDLRINRALRDRIARGELAGPRIQQAVMLTPEGGSFVPSPLNPRERLLFALLGMTGVPYQDPASGVLVFSRDAPAGVVRDAVDRAIDERGAECLKVYDQTEKMATYTPGAQVMTRAQLAALCDRARARGRRVVMHQVSVESFRRGVACGVSTLAHQAVDGELTPAEIDAFVRAGCLLDPTLSLAFSLCFALRDNPFRRHPRLARLTAYRRELAPQVLPEYWIPKLRQMALRGVERGDREQIKTLGVIDLARALRYHAPIVARGVENVRRLWKAGATLALGNDGGAGPPLTPAMVNLELRLLAFFLNEEEPLFGPADALRVATQNAARSIGLEDRLGTLEPGKIADLVVLDGDPLRDLTLIGQRAAAVFKEGALVINPCGLKVEPAPAV